jgi:hypothetical protein
LSVVLAERSILKQQLATDVQHNRATMPGFVQQKAQRDLAGSLAANLRREHAHRVLLTALFWGTLSGMQYAKAFVSR